MFKVILNEKDINIIIMKDDVKETTNASRLFDDLKENKGQIYWDKGVFEEHFKNNNLKEDDGYLYWNLGHFANCFNTLTKNKKNKSDEITKFLLKNIILNRTIPDYTVINKYYNQNKYDLEKEILFVDLEKIDKEYQKYSKTHNETMTTYKCNDEIDLYVASLFHFVTRGYILKWCLNCRKYFFEKDIKVKFCDRPAYKKDGSLTTCKEQYKSNRESKRVNNDEVALYTKKLYTRYNARTGDRDGLSNFRNALNTILPTLNKDERVKLLKDWVNNDPFPIKKGGAK